MNSEPKDSSMSQAVKLLLPKEHGSWSFVLEPLALGLVAVPSAAGAALAVAAVSGFFLRRPLKLLSGAKADPRRLLAMNCVAILSILAVAALLLAVYLGGVERLWPLLPAAMAGLVFMWFDSRNEAREGMVEVAGAMAFALLPAAFGTLAGWRTSLVLALAAIMLARAVPTVMFVRTYVRSNKGRAVTRLPAMIAAGVGLILTAWLVHAGLAPWPAAAFALLLIARAAWLLGPLHPRLAAKTVGMTEMAWGVATVLTVAIAWRA